MPNEVIIRVSQMSRSATDGHNSDLTFGDEEDNDDDEEGSQDSNLDNHGSYDNPDGPAINEYRIMPPYYLDDNDRDNDRDRDTMAQGIRQPIRHHEDVPIDDDADEDRPAEIMSENSDSDTEASIDQQEEPPDSPESIHAEEQVDTVADGMDERYGPRSATYNLRPRKPRDYSHLHATLKQIAMTQYSLNKGLKEFGITGVQAVLNELQQLHDRNVLTPVFKSALTHAERKLALPYLMFLKQKRSGQVKGRGCADGRKQRSYMTKEEVSSPTVSIESVMLTSVVDAMEGRDIATVDIPGAFMQAEMDETVYMRLDGRMAELLVQINPKAYQEYIADENGRKTLYVKLNKALYGTLRAALLFWKKLTDVLTTLGFEINPYDWCVANKEIQGSTCTIIWHVDDLKISHLKASVVTSVINQISSVFGKEAPLSITRGRIHEYLGMTLDFSCNGKVTVRMEEFVKGILDEAPEDMMGTTRTPAANHLFDVNTTNPTLLPPAEARKFHHLVAKLLFLCKRSRPDVHTAVSFLCTRVKGPDIDDYKKLARVIKYLRATQSLGLTLESDHTNVIKWWVDASYGTHPDMRSHTGGVMSLGKGAIYSTSTRQKLNTRSSTEGELVAVHDVLPQIIWTRYFLEAQGIKVKDNVLFQDNKSAMLLETNGRGSSSKRTRHINVRYFFVKDRIGRGDISLEHCPTEGMIADFFTKPLQGRQFELFRDLVMNADVTRTAPHDQDYAVPRSVLGKLVTNSTSDSYRKNEASIVDTVRTHQAGLANVRVSSSVDTNG